MAVRSAPLPFLLYDDDLQHHLTFFLTHSCCVYGHGTPSYTRSKTTYLEGRWKRSERHTI
jgi:hypothetical protein